MSWWALLTLLWPLWLRHRPEEQTPLWGRRSLILLIGLLMLRYLHWRVTASLNLSTPLSTGLSLGLLLAEAWLLLTSLIALGLACGFLLASLKWLRSLPLDRRKLGEWGLLVLSLSFLFEDTLHTQAGIAVGTLALMFMVGSKQTD